MDEEEKKWMGGGEGGLCRVVCGRLGALKGLDENRFTAND